MSQVAAKKKLTLKNSHVRVTALFFEEGSVLGGNQEGRCEGFHIELIIDSDESPNEIAHLMHLAHRMCFTESVLVNKVTIVTSHILNGEELDI